MVLDFQHLDEGFRRRMRKPVLASCDPQGPQNSKPLDLDPVNLAPGDGAGHKKPGQKAQQVILGQYFYNRID